MKKILFFLLISSVAFGQYNGAGSTFVTGQSGQTASGNNIVLAVAGTGSYDAGLYNNISIQIVPTGTVSSGVVTFEGSNDNTNFTPVPLFDESNVSTFAVSSFSPATSVIRYFNGSIHFRYFRARISTVIGGGGSLQAFTNFSRDTYQPDVTPVGQDDLFITGAAAQTATVNNIIPLTSGSAATDLTGYRSAAIQVTSTGTAGTFIFEGSNDNVNFQAIPVWNQLILTGTPITAAITATASQIIYVFPVTPRFIRLRIATTITGGSIQAYSKFMQAPFAPPIQQVAQATAANLNVTASGTVTANLGTGGTGATAIGKAEDAVAASGDTGPMVLGVRRDALTTSSSATGDYNEIATNRFGAILNAGFRTTARTYSASANITLAASATDVVAFFGNATSTVHVTKIRVTGIQTTTGIVDFLLVRRSTANTGGTSSNFSLAQHETTDAVNNSTPIAYTANPTPGTSLGNIRRWYQVISATTTPEFSEYTLEFGENGKPLVLSGTAQGICLNLNGATVTGGVINVSIEWIEF